MTVHAVICVEMKIENSYDFFRTGDRFAYGKCQKYGNNK